MQNLLRTYCLISILCVIYVSAANSTILVGAKNQPYTFTDNWVVYQISTNYKHLSIAITELRNVDKMIITDKPLDSYDATDCSPYSNICQSNLEL